MFIKPKYIETFILGSINALGMIATTEIYKVVCSNPIDKKIKEKKSKKRFNNIMSQTNLKGELA